VGGYAQYSSRVGSLGVPVIAPTVGGVEELISEQTGYPLPARASVADYRCALLQIASEPVDAARRAEALLNLIKTRHSWEAFIDSVKEIPFYFYPIDENREESSQ